MPSPKRWFPKSRDFNDDPEGWELTDTFGDRTVRLWDEICAILDKTDNHWEVSGRWLASLSRKVRQSSATVSRVLGWLVANHWLTIEQVSTDGSPLVYSSPNYWKYHKKQETKGEIQGPAAGAGIGPSLPDPSGTEPSSKEDTHVNSTRLTSFAEDWNRDFADRLATVRLPLSDSRKRKLRLRLQEHPEEDFWDTVFTNIGRSKFLIGNGSQGWKCTFDFIIENDTNCVKIAEGQYAEGKTR